MIKKVGRIVDRNHIIHPQARRDHIHREVPQILEAEVILPQVVVLVSAEADIQKIQMKKEEMKLFKIKKDKN